MSRKKVRSSEDSPSAISQYSTAIDARPRRSVTRERLKTSVLEELWSIWRADPRVPSIKSRRLWAISRDATPRLVDNWFLRRRTCAKKAGQPMPDGSYDLPLDRPERQIAPKREHSATPIELEFEAVSDLPSDDTLVYPDLDYLDESASSDTVCNEDRPIESNAPQILAYKEFLPQPRPAFHHPEPKSSPADLFIPKDRHHEDAFSFENTSFPIYNQTGAEQSGPTCVPRPAEGAIQFDSDTTPDSRWNLSTACPRLDFSPATLSELSAIPFLFRTPLAVPPNNAVNCQNANNWTNVEEELSRLVNNGKLDFSFLDVPYLASMELID